MPVQATASEELPATPTPQTAQALPPCTLFPVFTVHVSLLDPRVALRTNWMDSGDPSFLQHHPLLESQGW